MKCIEQILSACTRLDLGCDAAGRLSSLQSRQNTVKVSHLIQLLIHLMKEGLYMSNKRHAWDWMIDYSNHSWTYAASEYFMTGPSFRRRGKCSMLVKSWLWVTDHHQVTESVILEPTALKPYLNHEVQLLETVTTDCTQYGGTEPVMQHFLTRKPSQQHGLSRLIS